MAVLSSFQRIDRVLSGKPFGDGKDGAYSSATIPTLVYKSCSGSADSSTLTASTSSPFEVGDVILIHQSRGTGVGQWEINRISSVGSGTYGLQVPLQYTYTDSGASQAQAVKVPRYTDVTLPSGTWTTPSWNQNIQGIFVLACRKVLTVSSTLTANGNAGNYATGGNPGFGSSVGGAGIGHRGGRGGSSNPSFTSERGEGNNADRSQAQSANGTAGGGATKNDQTVAAGGGGGGYGSAGVSGQTSNSSNATGGAGGGTAGSGDLTIMIFGGGGGGGVQNAITSIGAGGAGGGMVILFAKTIAEITGDITTIGGVGGGSSAQHAGGGGGAGGSCLIICQDATLGTNKIRAMGGAGGGSSTTSRGGNGGTGRIAVHHSGTVTGTTNPTYTGQLDPTLVESGGGFFQFL